MLKLLGLIPGLGIVVKAVLGGAHIAVDATQGGLNLVVDGTQVLVVSGLVNAVQFILGA